jgi:hypothetical protein
MTACPQQNGGRCCHRPPLCRFRLPSHLRAISALPDMFARHLPGGRADGLDTFGKSAIASACASVPRHFHPASCQRRLRAFTCDPARAFHRRVARKLSSVALRAFPWRHLKAVMSIRVGPAKSAAPALWITGISGLNRRDWRSFSRHIPMPSSRPSGRTAHRDRTGAASRRSPRGRLRE